MAERPYSRLYHSLVDDPMFAEVYGNAAAFGTWCQLLMIADALYPASAPLPRKTYVVRLLLESGVIQERPGNRYVIRGLEGERERRSSSARNAAAMRWQSNGNAEPMPRRDETRRDETSIGANALPTTFLGFPSKSAHNGQHPGCLVCAPLQKANR